MKKKKAQFIVWILQTGEPLHSDEGNPRPMRAMNLANAIVSKGHKVVLWSSAFNHSDKKHRCTTAKDIVVSEDLIIRLIPSPGYVRNIGLRRLWDHAVMASNLSKMLKREKDVPNVAFIGYPPIETATVMGTWLKKRGVDYMVDIKDQWPSIFVEAVPKKVRFIGRLIFSPYFYLAKKVMKSATGLSAMSKSFLDWSVHFAGRSLNKHDRVVPLTKPNETPPPADMKSAFEWWSSMGINDDHIPKFCFVGSHSQAFDMLPVSIAAKQLHAEGNSAQFIICGDGPLSSTWRRMMGDLPNVYFPGWIDRSKAEALASLSTAALAPYNNVDNFILNLPNKIIDSLGQGLPILSPLKGEVQKLINTYKIGLNYGKAAEMELLEAIKKISSDKTLRAEMSTNAKALFNDQFSYEHVYGGLVDHLVDMARKI